MSNKGKRKELQVAALENGTAIDHIPPAQLFKVAELLGLDKMNNHITISRRKRGYVSVFFHGLHVGDQGNGAERRRGA